MCKARRGWALLLVAVVAGGCGPAQPDAQDEAPLDAADAAIPGADAERVAGADANGTAEADASAWPDVGPLPADAGEPCRPRADGPYWLTEGEPLEFQVRCAIGARVRPGELEVSPLPSGARFDATTATMTWTPRLDQAAVYRLRIRSRSTGEEAFVEIGVADRFFDSGNSSVRDPAAYTEEYGVPAMFVSYSGTVTSDVPIPADVTYRGRVYHAALKHHGVTSLKFPKKSYGLKFSSTDPFSDPDRGGGFVNRDKIRLTTTFDDNTYVRQRLGYALWSLLDPAHIEIKTYPVVVFLNGRYHGLYLLSDDVDKGLLAIEGLSRNGNLYKATSNDANFSALDEANAPKLTLHDGFEKKEGYPAEGQPGAFDDLDQFVALVANSPADELATMLPKVARLEDFEAFWMFVTFLKAGDNSRKNYYLFHDPAGGPWRYAPWDLNGSFGQTWRTLREPASVSEYAYDNALFDRMLAEPSFGLRRRFGNVLRNQWALAKVLSLYDSYASETEAAARRDERRWGAYYRNYSLWSERTDFLDRDGEVAYVRDWIEDHWSQLASRYRP